MRENSLWFSKKLVHTNDGLESWKETSFDQRIQPCRPWIFSSNIILFLLHRQQRREQVEILLNHIYERMQARTPKDHTAKLREDSSQIKSYFRLTNPSKSTGTESEFSIELVEHEIDLRTRGLNEHKCTLVFNKLLKIGVGARDRLKRTAKIRAYEKLKTMTRDTPREHLVIKPTRDGLWKVINTSPNNQ